MEITFINNFPDHVFEIALIKIGVKKKSSSFFLESNGWDFSVGLNLLWIDHGVTCFLPCLHAPCEAFGMRISPFEVLGSLTGSTPFFGSGTVENDLLVFW